MKLLLLSFIIPGLCALSLPYAPPPPRKVIITGAAGRTGKLVFSSLVENLTFDPVGLVRTEKSAKKVIKDVHCALEQICVCDVTQLDADGDNNGLPKGLDGAEAMIICTSAVPKISKLSVLKQFLKIPINLVTGKKLFNFRGLRFRYAPGQYPEKVDYEGQIAQIKLAKNLGISHVVLVSSMGGTDPENFLNLIGKDKDGNGNGDILLWKRKAEKYLIESGLEYTIIHPGGLKDTPGGASEFVLDVDDLLLKNEERSISRSDVANLCIASLTVSKGRSVSFDCTTKAVAEGTEVKSAEIVLEDFLNGGKSCDYSL